MSGRHRHAVDVRTDGLAAVLGGLLRRPGVRSAALIDVDSGMLLDGWVAAPGAGPDPEVLGAGHAELVRVALGLLPPGGAGAGGEVVVDGGEAGHHVLRLVPDPHGDRLALSVVVVGPRWAVARVRRRLRRVSAAALTAGPSPARRPGDGVWLLRRDDGDARPARRVPPPAAPAPPPAGPAMTLLATRAPAPAPAPLAAPVPPGRAVLGGERPVLVALRGGAGGAAAPPPPAGPAPGPAADPPAWAALPPDAAPARTAPPPGRAPRDGVARPPAPPSALPPAPAPPRPDR